MKKKEGNPGHIQLADAKVTINIDQLVIQDCVTANQYPDLAFLLSRREGKGDSIEHKGAVIWLEKQQTCLTTGPKSRRNVFQSAIPHTSRRSKSYGFLVQL